MSLFANTMFPKPMFISFTWIFRLSPDTLTPVDYFGYCGSEARVFAPCLNDTPPRGQRRRERTEQGRHGGHG
jgi:hypothetical protein